ncbi:3-oxoacyl-[acyl-carrier-protein] reductase FabG-like [Plutella xylostella]|uniref:3-oxoacyl-[acyl-carrier-protein] reductase FabG-like n=1 Tax=Plutella xylostella TaxID=51655 RepID=UPI0005D077C9|nr:3-oxoacyl-[acyl-carrier-protein] reductase FabG-like [Plutella xylostella]
MDFKDKVVIVTGGSSGIGAASARLFASHGALVAIIGRNVQRLDAVAKDCETKSGNLPLRIALDLTSKGACEEVVKATVEKYKRIDVLVNCAGKGNMASLFDDNIDGFDELIALNLKVPYRLTQLCVPYLIKTKGNIVNVYEAPVRSRPGMLQFSMVRDALDRFTKAGAAELVGEGVRMNGVRTCMVRSNFLQNYNIPDDQRDVVINNLAEQVMPFKRPIEAEEVARLIVFTASDMCASLNATSLCVDGAASSF